MALSIDTFLVSFPEFATTPAATVTAKLGEALLSIDPDVYRLKADTAQGYLAAHLLTLSPKGQNARMVVTGKNGEQATTTYWTHYRQIQRSVSSGFRVIQ